MSCGASRSHEQHRNLCEYRRRGRRTDPRPELDVELGSAAYTGGKELIGTFNQQAIASEQGLAQIRNPFPVACAVPPRCHAGGTVEGTREIGLR